MSHQATNWAIQQRGLRPATKLVLWHLADRHNPDFGCFPSQDQLAADCEISRSGLNLHLDELERLGLIRRERRINRETRKQMSTRYMLGFEDDFPQEPSPEIGHGEPEKPCPKNGDSRVQNLDTKPVIEPVSTTTDFAASIDDPGAVCLSACGEGLSDASRQVIRATDDVVDRWIAAGLDLHDDVLPVLAERTAHRRGRTIRTWDYFTEAVMARHARRVAQAARSQDALKKHASSGPPETGHLHRLAEWINSGTYVPPSAVSNTMRDDLLRAGLVTGDQLRRLQIY